MHLTAHKLLLYGYITPEELEKTCSLAIVRNPYSRMVSIYMYNRFGENESFQHFVRSWHNQMQPYLATGEMEEWYTPCHQIPQFEFTHSEGKQLVQSIVKQEELKFLKTKGDEHKAVAQDSTVTDLPDPVRAALLGMPHTNKRVTQKKWFEYYDQETLNLTFEMYKKDFQIFHYSPELKQRPDLKSPAPVELETYVDHMRRDSTKDRPELRQSRIMIMRKSSEIGSSRRGSASKRGSLVTLGGSFRNLGGSLNLGGSMTASKNNLGASLSDVLEEDGSKKKRAWSTS